MKSTCSVVVLFVGMLIFQGTAIAEPLAIKSDDSIVNILKAYDGKRVTLKLDSGEELTGTIGTVNENLVHLRELSGREFFDAAVLTDDISAVIIRTKE